MATKEFGVNKLNINSSTVVEGILDEDDLSSDSNVKLATQQSIKAYVDGKVTTDLDVSDGTTDISIDFGTEKLSILGTSGEINSVASGNDVTLSVPGLAASKITSGSFAVARIPNLGAGKITSGTFDAGRIPTLNQDTTGSAAKVKVTDNESTDEENLITFVADAVNTTGPQSLEMDGDLKYNPNTGTLSSPAISIGGASPSPSALSVKLTTNKHIGFNPNQSEVGYVPSLVAFNDSGSLQDMGFRGTTLRFAQASTERLHINSSGLLVNGSIKNIASIVNCSITSGGTDGGRTEGSYTVIDAGGSVSGTGADFVVDIDATGAAELTKKSGGTGYAANETITIAKADIGGGSADLVITVSSITPVVQFHGNGSNLTNLNGTNITSGTIAAARVATLNQDTTGSAAKLTTARTIAGVSFDGTANIDLPGVNTAGTQDTTGSAAKLTTARNIGGVSFDGTAAIDLPGVNTAGNQDTTGSAAKLTTARTIGGVSFDGSAAINLPGVNAAGNQNTTGSAAKLTTARTIGGVSFDGSANINLPGVNAAGNQDTSGNAGGLTGNPNIGVTGIIAGGTAIIENDFIVKADNKMLKVQNASGTDKFTVDTDNGSTSIIGSGTPTIESPSGGDLNITAATTAASGNLSVGGNITVAGTGTPTIESPSGGNLNITAATATFSGNITASSGTITGNGSGLTTLNGSNISSGTIAAARVATLNQNTSGSSASCTGNAATATKLAAAVNIGGVSFDGSAAINLPGVNAAGNQNTSGNAATATKLAAAVNIGGVSFDGTANINLPGVNAAGNQNTSGTAAGLSGTPTVNLYHNNKLRLEPVASGVQVLSGNASPYPLGTVTASSFVGALTGNASSATLATNAQGLTGTPNILIGNATATKVTTSTLEVGDISRGVNNGSVNITQEGTGLFTVHRTTESRDTRPETDSQYDLGEHAKRWRNVYADTLFGDGSNITNLPTGGISDIVSDTTPQLGGNLDPNGKNIEFGDSTTFGSDDTLSFGADDDFSIFHGESGSSYNDLNVIKTKNPAPHLLVELGSADGLKMMQVSGKNTNGTSDTLALFTTVGSQLYYNGTNRIGTTSSGSTLTGTVIFTGLIDANGGIDGTLNAGAQPNITSIGAATGGAGGVTSIRFNELDFKRTQVLWSSKYQWNYKIETSTLADHRINFFDDEQGNCSISLLTGNRAGGTSIIRSGKSSGNAGGTPGIYDTTIGASVHVAQNDGDVTLCTNTGYGPMGGIGGGHQNNGFEFSLGGTSKFCTESGNSDATVTMMRRDDGKAISFCEVISSSSISEIGSITLDRTANTTSFNENSDYRLKENVTNITGALAKINQLRPVNFNFIGKSVKLDGFLAHEVQAIVPYAVTGDKDAVKTVKDGDLNNDGSKSDYDKIAALPTKEVPSLQQMDNSKLIGLLTAAVQELSAKNDALEARIAALES